MASSTKMRLSSRRTSTSPPIDEDILASSSAGWKAVALPEPARMVSLPAIDELPSAADVRQPEKADRKSKKELKAERTSAKEIASAAIAIDTAPVSAAISPAPVAKPVVERPAPAASTPIVGARFAKPQAKSRTGLYAALGLGLAAAAGVGWYVSTQMGKKAEVAQVASVEDRSTAAPQGNTAGAGSAVVAAPTVEPIMPPPAPEPAAADTTVATGMGAAAAAPAGDDGKADEAARTKGKSAVKAGVKRDDKDRAETTPKPAEVKVDPAKPADKKTEGGEGEPSFDALLKEAGVQDKKPTKVVLDKKSLSGGDIKKGMSSINGKAQACYAGTQGTAAVKLTVSPDGSVSKVSVTGVFAGTPVASCIEAAVKGVSFPAWDGGPQSFGYSYLLAE
jgi:hypothetical protein